MSRKPFPPKNLLNMPDEVRWSALGSVHNGGITARTLRVVDLFLDLALRLVGFAAWLVGYYCLSILLMGLLFTPKQVPKELHLPATFFWGAWLLCAISHHFKVMLLTPRKDPDYPLIDDFGVLRSTLWALGLHSLACAVALWLWPIRLSAEHMFVPRVVASAVSMASVAFWIYYFIPPLGGRRAPSPEELAQLRERRVKAGTAASRDDDIVTPVELAQPALRFKDIYGMADTKARLLQAAQECSQDRASSGEAPRNGILLHGAPGNGKTIFVEALAGELGVPLVKLTYGAVASKWKNETVQLLSKSFAFARQNAPCVLFLDEVDTLLQQRDANWHIEDIKTINSLLTEIVDIRQHRVILVAATNFLESLDQAAIREGRFDFKVGVPPPDLAARQAILAASARKALPRATIKEAALARVAGRWNGFSVSRLVAVGKALPEVIGAGKGAIDHDHWLAALRQVQGQRRKARGDTKSLDELVLPPGTRAALDLLADRLQHAVEAEALGATVPRGAVFHGPPGTGKTVAAQALAAGCDWAFVPVAGPELVEDQGRLQKILEEAADLRPAIVFIDEADDVLRSRSINPRPEIVNRLLSLMDGVGPLPRDVLIVAATNHLDQVDEALLRAGRFTEKIEFCAPDVQGIREAIRRWVIARKVELYPELAGRLAESLSGESVATVEGVLQYALNRAAVRQLRGGTANRVVLLGEDLEAGMDVVGGEGNGSSRANPHRVEVSGHKGPPCG